METVLMIIAALSLVAFVVGMFNPKTVKCSSRGKVALIYVSVFLITSIIGTSISDGTDSNSNEVSSYAAENGTATGDSLNQNQDDVPQEATIGTEVQVGNFAYRVDDIAFKKSVGNEFVRETADGVFLIVYLSLVNIDNESHTLDGSMFSLTDMDGTKYEYSIDGSTALEMSGHETIFLKRCQPKIVTSGVLIFEVPQKKEYYLNLIGNFWDKISKGIAEKVKLKRSRSSVFIFVISVMDLSQFLENKFIMERLQCRGDPAVLFFPRQFSLHRIDRWI